MKMWREWAAEQDEGVPSVRVIVCPTLATLYPVFDGTRVPFPAPFPLCSSLLLPPPLFSMEASSRL